MDRDISIILSYIKQLKLIHQKDCDTAKKRGDAHAQEISIERWKAVDSMNLWIKANILGLDIFDDRTSKSK